MARLRGAGLCIACGLVILILQVARGNPIRNADFEDLEQGLKDWSAPENVSLELVEIEGAGGKKALKVAWNDVLAFERWAAAGGLLKNPGELLKAPLLRDTRYRLSCRIKVERFEVSQEAKDFLESRPEGQFDPPTIGVGCYGGKGNSGMPWMAYDMSKIGTWQDLQSEFVTPYTGSQVFRFLLDAYPHYRSPMKSSGVLYLDDLKVEALPARVGFTRTESVMKIDGDLSDWWQTNPAVITKDMVVIGDEKENQNASGVVFTMWDDEKLYLAAKVIDDQLEAGDRFVVKLDSRTLVIPALKKQQELIADLDASSRNIDQLGSTVEMYRIVSQYGDEVALKNGYVVEMAISFSGDKPKQVAFEIHDQDGAADKARVLRFPYLKEGAGHAEIAYANAKGELKGGDRPVYAITDAANDRSRARVLSVKNVASHLLSQGRLAYPLAKYRQGGSDKVDALISWSTNMPTSGFIELGEDPNYGKRIEASDAVGEKTGNAMRVILRDLEPDHIYHYRVGAGSGKGAAFSSDRVLDTRKSLAAGIDLGEIPLTLLVPGEEVNGTKVVTSGVPFPKGHLASLKNLRLLNSEGETVNAQFTVTSEWPDASIRWVLVDFQSENNRGNYRLRYGRQVKAEVVKSSLIVEEEADHISVDTGAVTFTISKVDFNLFDEVRIGEQVVAGGGRMVMTDDEGVEYVARKPDIVEVEELGPMRVSLRVAGKYENSEGKPFFDYEVRIHAYAGLSTVRVNHNYTCRLKKQIDPTLNRSVPISPEAVKIRSMWMELPVKNRSGNEVAKHEIRQITENRASINGSESSGGIKLQQVDAWMAVEGVMVGLRQFRELYPKAMSIRPDDKGALIRVDTMPTLRAEDYPSEVGEIEDYVWGYLRGGRYRLRRGEGRSHDVLFNFSTKSKDLADVGRALTAQPVFASASPEWYCASGVIGTVQPEDERYADYDFAFRQGVIGMRKTQLSEPQFGKRFGRLGLRNFGDFFGSDGSNWDNGEYDMGYSCLLQFMRSSDPMVLQMARDVMLHSMDVDTLTLRDGYEWPCGHQGDHSVQFAGLGHTWTEGLWNYYFLTGDRRAARKALGVSNTVAHRTPYLTASGAPGAGGARDYGWSVIALMSAYGATADPTFLNAAKEIEEVVVRTQHPFRGGWLHKLSPGHCFHAPAHTGRVYFMHEIVLAGQVRFFQQTGDADVAQCLKKAVNGIVDEYNGQMARGLPGGGYTSCPFMVFPGEIQTGYSMNRKHSFRSFRSWEPLYFVDAQWPGTGLHKKIKKMLGDAGPPRFSDPVGHGKGFAQQTRWTPSRIYWILKSGKWE